jgi:hypothetical protein
VINPLTPELNPPRNAACQKFLLGILIFIGLTSRRLYKSFGVKGLTCKPYLTYDTDVYKEPFQSIYICVD